MERRFTSRTDVDMSLEVRRVGSFVLTFVTTTQSPSSRPPSLICSYPHEPSYRHSELSSHFSLSSVLPLQIQLHFVLNQKSQTPWQHAETGEHCPGLQKLQYWHENLFLETPEVEERLRARVGQEQITEEGTPC